MELAFYKYQGTGNDFVLIDNRLKTFDTSNTKRIQHICDRKFGVGADGFICLENDANFDFKMVYFNADGNESTMCGNGGRCIVAFAKYLNIIENYAHFVAIDGPHNASIKNDIISLQMQNVADILVTDTHVFLNTGSPHHISYQKNIHQLDIKLNGSSIRNGAPYFKEGTNVNFVEQIDNNTFKVRTYERGVEDETLSCGTGVTAVAIASHKTNKTHSSVINLQTEGGNLKVSFKVKDNVYTDVFLEGPAVQVFKGNISI
ncbi:MAG: diaminopimelate epimerase [Flavobacteriales bacterium]|jgi:diaminopimelate epimerase|nr:diaminopimelate epimerase [Flavobacteriales bacterium]